MNVQGSGHERPQAANAAPAVAGTGVKGSYGRWRIVGLTKHWASEHTSEIFWAFVFAVLVGYALELYFEQPSPYKIYVVADPDTDSETLKTFQSEARKDHVARIGRVKIRVQLEILPDQGSQTAAQKAEELANRADTLLVIQHGRSQKVLHSVQAYFGARPQVPLITTVATDDDLLTPCLPGPGQAPAMPQRKDTSCFDGDWFNSLTQNSEPFAPLLQLSPANEVQGRSAVQFAAKWNERHFMVVLGSDPNDQSYTDDMAKAYSSAIREAHAVLAGVFRMNAPPTESDLKTWKPHLTVLYAGSVGEAQTLCSRLSALKPPEMEIALILSDSVIQSRGTDADLAAFSPMAPGGTVLPSSDPDFRSLPSGRAPAIRQGQSVLQGPAIQAAKREPLSTNHPPEASPDEGHPLPVYFTYQTDANDYNFHTNAYVDDAFSLALQLIRDLKERGGDIGLRARSLLHMENAKDARRNLLGIMRQNSNSRTWYKSASGRMPYIFDGHKQYAGIFHVWQVRPSPQPGSQMDDVDNWHPPRTVMDPRGDGSLAAKK
jgi:hypothetical protein